MNEGLRIAASKVVNEPVEYAVRVNIVGMIRVRALAIGLGGLVCVMSLALQLPVLVILALVLYFLTARVGWLLLRATAEPLHLGTGGGVLALNEGTVYLLGASSLTGKPRDRVAAWPRSDVYVSAAPGEIAAWPSVWVDVAGQKRARLEIAANGGKARARDELIAALGASAPGRGPGSPVTATAPRKHGGTGTGASGEQVRFLNDSEKAALATFDPPATEAAWYPDPFEPEVERYWNGGQWTGRTRGTNG